MLRAHFASVIFVLTLICCDRIGAEAPKNAADVEGLIESVAPSNVDGFDGVSALVATTKPANDRIWVHAAKKIQVIGANGGVAALKKGDRIRVWTNGEFLKTDPAQVYATHISVEKS